MKKAIIIMLVIMTLVTAAYATSDVTVTEAGNFHILYNGTEQSFTDVNGTPVLPLVNNGTTYLPVRAVSSLAGLNVNWVAETSTIELTTGGTQATYAGTPTRTTYTVSVTLADNFTITLDGTVKTFTDANGTIVFPIVNNGTTYLPLRAVCGLVNIPVDWDGATSTIYLGAKPAAPVQAPTNASLGEPVATYNDSGKPCSVYKLSTNNYQYLCISNAIAGEVYVVDGPDGNLATVIGCVRGTSGTVDVTGYSTVYLIVLKGTVTSVTLENPAVVPAYSIPSGAVALTDANTTFSAMDTTYSNGQFVRHNRAPGSHTPGAIKYRNTNYTTITFTVITQEDTMCVQVESSDTVVGAVRQAPNTVKTYTMDITGLTNVGPSTYGITGNLDGCDSVITNVYVQ